MITKVQAVLLLLAVGCAHGNTEKPLPEDGLPVSGAADSWGLRVARHGALSFTEKDEAQLEPSAPAHAWTFELTRTTSVSVETLSSHRGLDPDTVLYLYEVVGDERRLAAEPNDDGGEGYFSRVSVELDPGNYEVVVTGYDRSVIGRFAIALSCTSCEDADPATLSCAAIDMEFSNPCPDAQYCAASELSGDHIGTCRPAQELYDASIAEFVRRFGDDPGLWSGRAPRGMLSGYVIHTGATPFVHYVVELQVAYRKVTFFYRADGSFYEDLSGGFFRVLEDGRVLEPGAPTIFVTAPEGETLDRFVRELETGDFEHVPLPLEITPIDSSILVLGVDPLYEVETLEVLRSHFRDHSFDFNGTHLTTGGRQSILPLTQFP